MCIVFFRVVFFRVIFLVFIKITSLSATASSAICLEDFWSDSKENIFLRVEKVRTDSLTCDLSVFISTISECKQVELSAAVLSAFLFQIFI